MATRSAKVSDLESKIMTALTEWESTESNPAKISEIAGEFGVSETEVFNTLGKLEDAGKVDASGRGLTSAWWVKSDAPAETPKPKRTRRTKAEMDAAREEERKRLEYATRAAESQDEIMSQTPENRASVIPAVEPIQGSDGENVTVPVDFDAPEKGRRELDASKGERVIGEDDMSALIREVKAESKEDNTTPETSEATVVFHEPKNPECPGNDIPPVPMGVNVNTWELAHDANTYQARAYWKRVADTQRSEFLALENEAWDMNEAMDNDTPPF